MKLLPSTVSKKEGGFEVEEKLCDAGPFVCPDVEVLNRVSSLSSTGIRFPVPVLLATANIPW